MQALENLAKIFYKISNSQVKQLAGQFSTPIWFNTSNGPLSYSLMQSAPVSWRSSQPKAL